MTEEPRHLWLLSDAADEPLGEVPEYRPRHAARTPNDLLLAARNAGIAVAATFAVVISTLFALDLGRSGGPSAAGESSGGRGLAAAETTAPASVAVTTTPATASTSAKPSKSATKSASASPSTSRSTRHQQQTSSSHSVAPPSTSTHSQASSTSASRSPSTSHLTITISVPGGLGGTVTIAMPAGWTITSTTGGVAGGSAGSHGGTWIVGSRLIVYVTGPAGSNETMTATIKPTLSGRIVQTYRLN